MVTFRPPQTAKYALQRVISVLPMPTICAALGDKQPKRVYKYSEPGDKAEITVKDALILDPLVFAEKGIRPFFDLFDMQGKAPAMRIGSIRENMLTSQAALGRAAAVFVEATGSDSEAGKKLSNNEIQAFMFEIERLEAEVARLKAAVISAAGGSQGWRK